MDWVKRNQGVFREVASDSGVRMRFDTHYDASNYEYSKVVGSEIYRLDFQPTANETYVVKKFVDKFPFFPRLFWLAYNFIPLFPYLAEIQEVDSCVAELGSDEPNLKAKVLRLVRDAL